MKALVKVLTKILPYSFQRKLEDAACWIIGKTMKMVCIRYRGFQIELPAEDVSAAQIYFRYLLTGSWRHEIFEQSLVDKILTDCKNGVYFIDGGANYGMYSLLAASISSVRKVYSIEASPKTFSFLKKTICKNNLTGKVECINAAISEKSGELHTVTNYSRSEWNSASPFIDGGDVISQCVRSLSLDDLIFDMPLTGSSTLFIKLDIEGNEPRALHGLQKLFSSGIDYVIMAEFHAGVLNSNGEGALVFTRWLWSLNIGAIYQINNSQKKLVPFNSVAEFEDLTNRLSSRSFPDNLTNILICKQCRHWFS